MPLNKQQAIRLVEKYGNIPNIYRQIDLVSPAGVQKILHKNKEFILSVFDGSDISKFNK